MCSASACSVNHILEGKKATCHPGFEEKLLGAQWLEQPVVVDGNVITSRGMGTAIAFALRACQILHRRCHSRAYSTGTGILIQRSANNHIISIITKRSHTNPMVRGLFLCLHLKRTFEACYCRAYFICCSCFMIICLTISPPIEPACLEVRSPL